MIKSALLSATLARMKRNFALIGVDFARMEGDLALIRAKLNQLSILLENIQIETLHLQLFIKDSSPDHQCFAKKAYQMFGFVINSSKKRARNTIPALFTIFRQIFS
ncbi:hypothetical protein BIV59_03515 [Bacillus sp. MUM 13]|nr:hypothetical protein BIV59_03515 [Bacillus sp. MUM 13]